MSFSLSQYTEIDVGSGLTPDPMGSLQHSPRPPSWFQLAASRHEGNRGEGREGLGGGEDRKRGKGGMGKGGERGELGEYSALVVGG